MEAESADESTALVKVTGPSQRRWVRAAGVAGLVAMLLFFGAVAVWFIDVRADGKRPCAESTYGVIIGSGISGIGAGQALSKRGLPFIILEAEEVPGGHETTLHIPSDSDPSISCDLNIGYMYGHPKAYKSLLSVIRHAGLTTGHEEINFTTASFSNTKVTRFEAELQRFFAFAKNATHTEDLRFLDWLKLHGFSDEFIQEVIFPAVRILFVVGPDSFNKSAYELLGMLALAPWIGLLPSPHPGLFRVRGGNNQIIKSLLGQYAMDLRIDAKVTAVEVVSDRHVEVQVHSKATGVSKGCIMAEEVIWSTSPTIVRKTYVNPTLQERVLLDKYPMRTSYGILHTCPNLFFEEMLDPTAQYSVTIVEPRGTAILSGKLGYENQTVCPHVLSISESQEELNSYLRVCEGVLRRYVWEHPVQDMETLGQLRNETFIFDSVRFVGSWTVELSHENAYRSGLELGGFREFS